jgi:hypothetical protein
MLRLLISITVASCVILFFHTQSILIVNAITEGYRFFYETIGVIFSSSEWGQLLHQLVVLLLMLIVMAGVPTCVYSIIYKKQFAYVQPIVFGVWLVLITLCLIKF